MPAPEVRLDGPLQMLISNLEYNDYVGRIALGAFVWRGLETGQEVVLSQRKAWPSEGKIGQLYSFEGLKMVPITRAEPGDTLSPQRNS